MAKLYKNKFFLSLAISILIFLLLKGLLFLGNIELGLGGTYTQKRAQLTNIALFVLMAIGVFSAVKGKVSWFNLFFILFSLVLIEGVIEEKGDKIGIRKSVNTKSKPKSVDKKKDKDTIKSPEKTPNINQPKTTLKKDKKVNPLPINRESSVSNDLLGYSLIPGEFLTVKNCYKVIYTNTKDSIRYNPIKNVTQKSAALFGCSFTYGTGLNDEETLAANLARIDSTRNYLNFGQEGWGMQQMLAILSEKIKHSAYTKEVINQADLGIYFYLEDHIYRLLGKNHLVSYHWGTNFPFYEVDLTSKKVKRNGTLGGQLSFAKRAIYFPVHISLIYKKIYYKFIYKGVEPLNETDLEKAALVIKEAKNAFQKTGKDKRFIVVLFPNTNNRIKNYLLQYNIELLDLSKLIEKADVSEYVICNNDNHPNAKMTALVSKEINQALTVVKE